MKRDGDTSASLTWDGRSPAFYLEKYSRLIEGLSNLHEAPNDDLAVQLCLGALGKLGFSNGMISLLFEAESPSVIRAVAHFGDEWAPIADQTIRIYPGHDLLARVLADGESVF